MTRIALDAMGGDYAPKQIVVGAVDAACGLPEVKIFLVGKQEAIQREVGRFSKGRKARYQRAVSTGALEIVHAPDEVEMSDVPVEAVRKKKDCSINVAMRMVKEGRADVFVSAGNSGAVATSAILNLGRIPGVERPALAPLLPNGKGHFLLIDCGANVDCKPEYLVQFGLMGEAYMRGVMGMKEPRVGLVNIGAEAEKGNALVKETYPLMEKAPYRFVGNVEARDITADQADVLVADGFSGNLILKFMEGVAATLMGIIKKEMMADLRGKIAGLIAKPAFRRVKKTMDYTEVGGAPLLGVKGVVVKAHGSSNAHAIACAIRQAALMKRRGLVDAIEKEITKQLKED